jgi:hypothetical protein
MTVTGLTKSYSILFGPLIPPYSTLPYEAVTAWLYLYVPRLQSLDPGFFGVITQLLDAGAPVLVGIAAIVLYRRDVVPKATLQEAIAKEKEERAKSEAAIEKAHAAELAAFKAAQQREREQFEASIQEKRLEIEQWQQRWGKAASGAEKAVELLLQQKVP